MAAALRSAASRICRCTSASAASARALLRCISRPLRAAACSARRALSARTTALATSASCTSASLGFTAAMSSSVTPARSETDAAMDHQVQQCLVARSQAEGTQNAQRCWVQGCSA